MERGKALHLGQGCGEWRSSSFLGLRCVLWEQVPPTTLTSSSGCCSGPSLLIASHMAMLVHLVRPRPLPSAGVHKMP